MHEQAKSAGNPHRSQHQIIGRIDSHSGMPVFSIVAKILSTGEQCGIPNAAEALFDAMIAHFAATGGHPTGIRGIWESRDPERTTNLNRFNAALLAGDDEEAAAGMTFTGRMAAKHGYARIAIGHTGPPNGVPGRCTLATAYFRK